MNIHCRRSARSLPMLLALLVVLTAPLAASATRYDTPTPGVPTRPVIFFTAAGMRPDLLDRYEADGAMDTFADLIAHGVQGDGLAPPFPATPGAAWPTLATGTWPGEHGVTNSLFFRTGSPDFAEATTLTDPGIIQADTIAQAAERAGKRVVAIDWPGLAGLNPGLQGPVVDGATAFSAPTLFTTTPNADQQKAAARYHVGYQPIAVQPAADWVNVPDSFSPPQELALEVRSTAVRGLINPHRHYALYISDTTDDQTANYDRVLVAPGPGPDISIAKDGANPIADLAPGEWAEVKLSLTGERDGETAGFYLNLLELTPDLSDVRLYATAIARANISFAGCEPAPDCTGPLGVAETIAAAAPSPSVADHASLAAGLIDEETFAASVQLGETANQAILRRIIAELDSPPDLLLLGTTAVEDVSYQFLGLVTPTDLDGASNPFYDDANADGVPDNRLAIREEIIRGAYEAADDSLAAARDLLGEANIVAASTNGFAPAYWAVNAGLVLQQAAIAADEQTANCQVSPAIESTNATAESAEAAVGPVAKVCWTGGTAQIYINLIDREPGGVVPAEEYATVRDQIVAAFTNLIDPAYPNKQIVDAVLTKEELRHVAGADALHPSRSGDVVVVLRPPYHFSSPTAGQLIAPAGFFGHAGFMPDLVSPAANVDMRAIFVAAGPDIAHVESPLAEVRAIDLAPTVAYLLGVPGPLTARGQILYQALANGDQLRELTILNISDFHGQLTPLSATADTIAADGAINTRFGVGGAAFLKPWFAWYRDDAPQTAIVVTAGDAVGATPPISSFFADTPTIEMMNLMGFDADALGNHNFDAGYEHMFGELAPLAQFPYLSANLVNGATAPADRPFQSSLVIEVDGARFALVGFSNPDIPDLTKPGALGPYRVGDPVAAINEEAALRRAAGAHAVVAMGHMGASGGNLTDPTGAVVEVADRLIGVDAVLGDHTDFQVAALRPNGVMLTENRSKGVTFARVRIVVDLATGTAVYKTADYHRPWTIGVTPDPTIQARLDALNGELKPILSTVVGTSTVAIPRADACGTDNGRTCESLIGDLIADAMRTTYGTDFAITNSGGIRADLTCPAEGNDFCPTDPAEITITRGQVLTVLPFGNVVITETVTGAELKAMLENGVAAMPEPDGGFPQVSGLCFTYDLTADPGARVISTVRQRADGSCTGDQIDFSEDVTYTLATNDFISVGGDGYPITADPGVSRDVLEQDVAEYIAATSPLEPVLEGRITCVGDGCPAIAS